MPAAKPPRCRRPGIHFRRAIAFPDIGWRTEVRFAQSVVVAAVVGFSGALLGKLPRALCRKRYWYPVGVNRTDRQDAGMGVHPKYAAHRAQAIIVAAAAVGTGFSAIAGGEDDIDLLIVQEHHVIDQRVVGIISIVRVVRVGFRVHHTPGVHDDPSFRYTRLPPARRAA